MAYQRQSVALDLDTDVTHQCYLHTSRDEHLIGIIEFSKPSYVVKWGDLEYFRRRTDEFSVMPLPDCINAMIIDIRNVAAFLDNEVPIIPWRLIEEDCPIRFPIRLYQGFQFGRRFDCRHFDCQSSHIPLSALNLPGNCQYIADKR